MGLSRDNILRSTDSGLSVFRHYIAVSFQVGKNFLNPLYDDKHASCNVFYDRRNNCYRLKDFGNDDWSGDCFAFVGKLAGLDCKSPGDFIRIMEKINDDLHLGFSESSAGYTAVTSRKYNDQLQELKAKYGKESCAIATLTGKINNEIQSGTSISKVDPLMNKLKHKLQVKVAWD